MRIHWLSCLVLFAACGDTEVPSSPLDSGAALDAGTPADASSNTPPDANVIVDAGAADAGVEDVGVECLEGTERQGDECVDINECLVDNGGCGNAERWRCENQVAQAPRCIFDCSADQRPLLEGVDAFAMGERVWPSALITYGRTACPLITNRQGKIVVASARLGRGRVLQTGHEHPMNRDLRADNHDGVQLVRNAVSWMTRRQETLRIGRHPGLFGGTANLMTQDGHNVSAFRPSAEALAEVSVYFANARTDYSDEEIEALNQWIRQGGGLIQSGFAWNWNGNNFQAVRNFGGNRTIRGSGITITKANQQSGAAIVPETTLSEVDHALYAVYAVARHLSGEEILSAEDQATAVATITFAISHLNLWVTDYYEPIRALMPSLPEVIPTAENPVRPADEPLKMLTLRLVDKFLAGSPFDQIEAHPAAADFPGTVPEGTPLTEVSLELEATYQGRSRKYNASGAGQPVRLSTGAYALPGQTFTVTVPERAAGEGLSIQIGAHSDRLWNKESIERFPQIIRRYPVNDVVIEATSAFGGPVYLLLPAGTEVGRIAVTIDQVVRAPHYQHGVTTAQEWLRQLRNYPAPWAEIEGNRVAFSVLTEEARQLEDPVALMTFWDEVLDAMADLEGTSHERVRKERFALDRQISGGALHSGYPMMGHLRHHQGLIDLEHIRTEGSWGPFHELGHNHQWRDWFLPGSTEASCNLWSVYIHENLLNLPTRTEGRLGPQMRRQRRQAYLNGGANFSESWNVWVALDTYLQLQEGFGWDLFTDVFTIYREESNASQGSEQDRIDEWITRTSNYTQRNLVPFYEAWGFPITPAVRTALQNLPEWQDNPMR